MPIYMALGFFQSLYMAQFMGIAIYTFRDLRKEFTLKLSVHCLSYKQIPSYVPKIATIYTK